MKLSADLIKSLGLHGAVLALLAMQFQGMTIKVKPSDAGNNQPILEAVAVKESEVTSELKRQASREQQKEKIKQQKLAEIEKKSQEALKQQKQAEAQLRATQQQAVALQKQQQKAEAQAKAKLEAEKAALKIKEQALAEQKVIQQKAAEEQKKKAQAALEKENARLAEEKAKAAAEKERLAKAAEEERQKALRQESEKLLQQALEQEAEQSLAQDEIEQYYGVIVKKIQQNWRRDYGEPSSLSCRVQVHLLPSGEVTDVRVLQSSGNPQFDRQATLAVLRSSPLPLPASQTARQAFLSGFDFLFKPEG